MAAAEFFAQLESRADPAAIAGVAHSYLFNIEGEGRWLVDVRDGKVTVTASPESDEADVEFQLSAETFEAIASRAKSPTSLYMSGKLKIDGDIGAALQLQKIF